MSDTKDLYTLVYIEHLRLHGGGDCAESVERIAKEYEELQNRMEDVRGRMLPAIVKYLLINSGDLDKCTESGIASGLRIPRSMARDLLRTLMKYGVVGLSDFGKIKPYHIQHIGPAVDMGLAEFKDYDEFASIFSPKNVPADEAPDISSGAPYTRDGKKMRSYIRYTHDRVLDILCLRFNGFLLGYKPLQEVLGKLKSPEWVARSLFGETGFPPELVADKVMDSLQLAVVDRALAYTNQGIADRDVGGEALRRIFAGNLTRVLKEIHTYTIHPLITLVHTQGPEEVLKGLRTTSPDGHYEHFTVRDERFDLSYLYAFSLFLESSCKIAEHFGADQSTVDTVRKDTARLVAELSKAEASYPTRNTP